VAVWSAWFRKPAFSQEALRDGPGFPPPAPAAQPPQVLVADPVGGQGGRQRIGVEPRVGARAEHPSGHPADRNRLGAERAAGGRCHPLLGGASGLVAGEVGAGTGDRGVGRGDGHGGRSGGRWLDSGWPVGACP
jgi:hypothetical protein